MNGVAQMNADRAEYVAATPVGNAWSFPHLKRANTDSLRTLNPGVGPLDMINEMTTPMYEQEEYWENWFDHYFGHSDYLQLSRSAKLQFHFDRARDVLEIIQQVKQFYVEQQQNADTN